MAETIIYVPSLNSTELLRTLARHGVNTFNLRVVNSVDLAKLSLMRSGVSITEEFVTKKEEPAIIASLLDGLDYFKITSFSDAQNIASTLSSVRMLLPNSEDDISLLMAGEFPEKNLALITIYQRYISAIAKSNQIDTISLIRKAISLSKPLNSNLVVLKEYPLTPLENKLLETVSNGEYTTLSLPELFKKEEQPLKIKSYVSAYGASNEIENVIGTILENNIPLDSCTIATVNSSEYSQLFYDLCMTHNIPVTFGAGVPISNSYPSAILKAINEWNTIGYNGIDALWNIIFCESFNRKRLIEKIECENGDLEKIIEMAGSLKISFDKLSNKSKLEKFEETIDRIDKDYIKDRVRKTFEYTKKLTEELENGPVYLIEKYSKVRDSLAGRIDTSAIKVINEEIEAYTKISGSFDISEIVPEILSKTVCSENSREGSLYVTAISSAVASLRENLFVVGLSASNFPGKATENYLVLDSDYLLLGDEQTVPVSENNIRNQKNNFNSLLTLSSALNNQIYLSFSNYSFSDLKEANPSSVLFEIYKKEFGEKSTVDDFNNHLENVAFFEQRIGTNRLIGKAYINGEAVTGERNSTSNPNRDFEKKYRFSPSAIENYLACPKMFYYQNILGMSKRDEDNPLEIMAANHFGTLIHEMMELLAKNNYSKDEFLTIGERKFDDFILSRPTKFDFELNSRKTEFLETLEIAFDTDPKNQVITAEKKIEALHPSGILLYGYPDRVEKLSDGTLQIADFKTGNRVKHINNDPQSCMQTLLYAFMIEQNLKCKVSKCEYRYVKKGVTVECEYTDSVKQYVNNKLEELKSNIDNGTFYCNEESCKYCDFSSVCEKNSITLEVAE